MGFIRKTTVKAFSNQPASNIPENRKLNSFQDRENECLSLTAWPARTLSHTPYIRRECLIMVILPLILTIPDRNLH